MPRPGCRKGDPRRQVDVARSNVVRKGRVGLMASNCMSSFEAFSVSSEYPVWASKAETADRASVAQSNRKGRSLRTLSRRLAMQHYFPNGQGITKVVQWQNAAVVAVAVASRQSPLATPAQSRDRRLVNVDRRQE
ncbi:uncharacterized protein PG998_009962 [Apiospora kogelbergensis]|uniref:Uncharacterized protein n=1 Tax=Apiospora kogelbergensis TaxID=1337665 RepID=A0AAW0R943_9PEZI